MPLPRLSLNPHFLLGGHLLILHVLAFGGWREQALQLLWVVAIGMFLLWQPFVAGERKITLRQGLLLVVAVLFTTLLLDPWLLLIWCGALAATIGGRVLRTRRRTERIGYLLAFGYLTVLTVLGVVPEISPAVRLDAGLRHWLMVYMPVVLAFLPLFPARAPTRNTQEAFDLYYGVVVFLVLAVFVLGTLAYMLVSGGDYLSSLFKAAIAFSGALLLLAWAWNPRAGFSGIGSAVSRYLLSVGLPIEQWLVQLSEESERHQNPRQFLEAAMRRLAANTWLKGVAWRIGDHQGAVGEQAAHAHRCEVQDAALAVSFRHEPSPAMRWHVEWLLRLAIEFYLVKRQAEELQRIGYAHAVYETGARVTHDVKNLLQSLQVLCFAAAQDTDREQATALLARQLPQISERLRLTLDKLQSPRQESMQAVDAGAWWQALQQRYAHVSMTWLDGPADGEQIPGMLFDRVAENLLQNALTKRQREAGLSIRAGFASGALLISDNGTAVERAVAEHLFVSPVASQDGLGIGLYHAARQAEALQYRLRLLENADGAVTFSLSRNA